MAAQIRALIDREEGPSPDILGQMRDRAHNEPIAREDAFKGLRLDELVVKPAPIEKIAARRGTRRSSRSSDPKTGSRSRKRPSSDSKPMSSMTSVSSFRTSKKNRRIGQFLKCSGRTLGYITAPPCSMRTADIEPCKIKLYHLWKAAMLIYDSSRNLLYILASNLVDEMPAPFLARHRHPRHD
jgi:hypothetical protein